MKTSLPLKIILPALLILISSCGADNNSNTSDVSILFSDAPVDSASSVTITVESMTFRRDSRDDIVVEQFDNEETFTIDLMDYQKEESLLVVNSVRLEVGEYSDLIIEVVDEDVNASFVEETPIDDTSPGLRKPIKVPSGSLKLGGFTVAQNSTQSFVIEFGLRTSLTYNPGPDRYILKPRGVRIVSSDQASSIVGNLDHPALNREGPASCNQGPDYRDIVYLYAGHELEPATMGDLSEPSLVGEGIKVPMVSEIVGERAYHFSYIPPGDYTLAISCGVTEDDADSPDGIEIPSQAGQLIELTLLPGDVIRCDFPSTVEGCLTVDSL